MFCGPLPCGFNSGGGIDNGGVLTLTDSRSRTTRPGRRRRSRRWRATSMPAASRPLRVDPRAPDGVRERNRRGVYCPNGQAAAAGGIGSDGGSRSRTASSRQRRRAHGLPGRASTSSGPAAASGRRVLRGESSDGHDPELARRRQPRAWRTSGMPKPWRSRSPAGSSPRHHSTRASHRHRKPRAGDARPEAPAPTAAVSRSTAPSRSATAWSPGTRSSPRPRELLSHRGRDRERRRPHPRTDARASTTCQARAQAACSRSASRRRLGGGISNGRSAGRRPP